MSKGLESLERIKSYFHPKQLLTREKTLNDLSTIEKELKALQIIKEKKIDTSYLSLCFKKENGLTLYNFWVMENSYLGKTLTQEEYDLLKEVLL